LKKILYSIIIVLLYAGCAGEDMGPIILVQDGKSMSVIVIADNPAEAAQQGAEDIQMWLKKSSGATVPIKSESEVSEKTKKSVILVGDSRRTQSLGIDSKTFDLEEFVIKTFSHELVIIGDDERPNGLKLKGTLVAVQVFAEDILGIRLLWPGELGEVVPRHTTIEVNDIDVREKPLMRRRLIVNLGFNRIIHPKLDLLGWDSEEYKKFQKKSDIWFSFQRLGGSFEGKFGHAFEGYWNRYGKEHPEWFALQPNGTRDNSQLPRSARLCVSNSGLIEHVARECIEFLKNNPLRDSASISPNDNGPQTFCFCDKCKAWDAPDGPIIKGYPSLISPTMRTSDGQIKPVSLTDRYVRFYSAVAEIVAKELPDRYLGAYAYSSYTLPPVHAKLHPNVIIGFVPESPWSTYLNDDAREKMLESWLKWSESAHQLFLRPNFLISANCFPTIYVHRLGEDMKFFADNRMLFSYFDGCYGHWSTNGLNYYVLAKLLWDPYVNVDEIIDDYCIAGFGPASEIIRRYFDKLEDITTQIAAERKRLTPQMLAKYYNENTLIELNGILDEAKRFAGQNDCIKERIEFLRTGLEYVPISRDYLLAKEATSDGDKIAIRKYMEETVKRVTWFQKIYTKLMFLNTQNILQLPLKET